MASGIDTSINELQSMRYSTEDAAPKQAQSTLEQNYQYLQDNIERLFMKVDNLESRLRIILIDGGDSVTARDSMGYGGPTTLSENLAIQCRRTQDLCERLDSLLGRIDL